MLKLILRALLMLMLLSAVYGCGDETTLVTGEGSDSGDDGGDDGGGDDGEGEGDSDSAEDEDIELAFGYIDDAGVFNPGAIGTGLAEGDVLAAAGNLNLSVTFVDSETGTPVSDVTSQVSFSSTCATLKTAAITPGKATPTDGTATAVYSAKGCEGVDNVLATVSVPSGNGISGGRFEARTNIEVAPDKVSSIFFEASSPEFIVVKGTGGKGKQNYADVTFKVVNQGGGPVIGKTVNFTLINSAGGAEIVPSSVKTQSDGTATVRLFSGNVPGTMTIKATIVDSGKTHAVFSNNILQLTAVPDTDSFSISVDTFNKNCYHYDNVVYSLSARLGDHYQNIVVPGTSVSFTSEPNGTVVGGCSTGATSEDGEEDASSELSIADGACSVGWVSGGDRTADGRTTILARADGEEAWKDANGNGVYDQGEFFEDYSEAWRDDDFDGVLDVGFEEIFDYPSGPDDDGDGLGDDGLNGTWDDANGVYDGPYCNDDDPAVCLNRQITIWKDMEIVCASHLPDSEDTGFYVGATKTKVETVDITADSATAGCSAGSCSMYFAVSDENGNMMPAGTTITVSALDSGITVKQTADCTVESTADYGPYLCRFSVKPAEDDAASGSVVAKVEVAPPEIEGRDVAPTSFALTLDVEVDAAP
jgi:hypothetical protein